MGDKKENLSFFLKRISAGVLISTLIASGLFIYNSGGINGELFLYDTIPYFNTSDELKQMFKFISDDEVNDEKTQNPNVIGLSNNGLDNNDYIVYTDGIDLNSNQTNIANGQINEMVQIEDSASLYGINDLIGMENVIYQDDSHSGDIQTHFPSQNVTAEDVEKLSDINYLKNNFYTIDKGTELTQDLIDVDKFLLTDLSVKKMSGPQVLIFHTHASELFSDSDPNNIYDGIVGVGDRLKKALEQEYGLEVLHITQRFDLVDGKTQILGAYERMEPEIQKIINENPSIQLAIDLHRDGLPQGTRLVTEIDGKQTAKIMFFNGLSQLKNKDGSIEKIASLPNPYLETNLALSFNLQLEANKLYPGFARKVYLKGYRFSLNMLPKSMLVEVGANTNTKQEAFNTVEPMAEIIANVISAK